MVSDVHDAVLRVDPGRGAAEIGGCRIDVANLELKRRIGYVPQELALYEELSARDNLRFFGSLYGLPPARLAARIDFALATAGLDGRADELVRTFSGGMKRRLNMVAALLHEPDFLILDEPTVGVDPQSRNLIFETLEGLVGDGTTLLYTTHYMEEVERLCGRVAIMDAGKVIAEGEIDELHTLVPGEQIVTIRLRDSFPGDLSAVPGVTHAEYRHPTLILELAELTDTLPRVLEAIRLGGGAVESVTTERTSLEEVFLHLTGRTLRD